jgi:hypothetical protein
MAGQPTNRVESHTGSTIPEGRDRAGAGRGLRGEGKRKTHSSISPSLCDDSLSLDAPPPPPRLGLPESARPIRNRTHMLLSDTHTETCRAAEDCEIRYERSRCSPPTRCGCGSVARLAAPPPGTRWSPPPPPPVEGASPVPLASTWSRGLEDGEGSWRFCEGILA